MWAPFDQPTQIAPPQGFAHMVLPPPVRSRSHGQNGAIRQLVVWVVRVVLSRCGVDAWQVDGSVQQDEWHGWLGGQRDGGPMAVGLVVDSCYVTS